MSETEIDERPPSEAEGEPLDDVVAQETIDLAADTLTGDVAAGILDLFKHRRTSWDQMPEKEQRDVVETINRAAEDMVRRACNIIAAGGRVTAVAELETFQQKGRELTAKLELYASSETVLALSDACGKTVQILFIDRDAFKGQRKPVEIDEDQPPLFDSTAAGIEDAATAGAA